MNLNAELKNLFNRQLASWPALRDRYDSLSQARWHLLTGYEPGSATVLVQFNPHRYRSSAATLLPETLTQDKCFLCVENQPKEQEMVKWEGYKVQVNPYPIFSRHFTIASLRHEPQRISGRIADMMSLAKSLPGYVVFYNGPHSGASAPHHFHFQAAPYCEMPLCSQIQNLPSDSDIKSNHIDVCREKVFTGFRLFTLGRVMYYFSCRHWEDASEWFEKLQSQLPASGEGEPGQNILCWAGSGDNAYNLIVFPRFRHRPQCYGEGENQFLVSPASVDLGGLITLARKEDFERITVDDVMKIFCEVTRSDDDAQQSLQEIENEKQKTLAY